MRPKLLIHVISQVLTEALPVLLKRGGIDGLLVQVLPQLLSHVRAHFPVQALHGGAVLPVLAPSAPGT